MVKSTDFLLYCANQNKSFIKQMDALDHKIRNKNTINQD